MPRLREIVEPHEDHFSWRQYWNFYWPLTLLSVAMIFSRQFQNGTLGRFADSTRELAIYSFAFSSFQLFNAAVIFIPQVVNALGRSAADRRVCRVFVAQVSLAALLPVLALGFTAPGERAVALMFRIEGRTLHDTIFYLRLLAPLIPLGAARQYALGLLIQARRTGLATMINVASTAVMVAVLLTGLLSGWSAVITLATGHLLALSLTSAWAGWLCLRCAPPAAAEGEPLSLCAAWTFYWPLAATSMMFALSRPAIFSFVNRTADGETAVAALRVALDLSMLFQNNVNQFRHMFVTFGRTHMTQLRRFILLVTAAISALMLAVALSPVGAWFFREVLRTDPEVTRLAVQAFALMCLNPLILAMRNYYHGLAMVYGRTVSMAAGAAARTVAIYLACIVLHKCGWLNHWSATLVLTGGFAAETLAVLRYAPRHEAPTLAEVLDEE